MIQEFFNGKELNKSINKSILRLCRSWRVAGTRTVITIVLQLYNVLYHNRDIGFVTIIYSIILHTHLRNPSHTFYVPV